MSDIESTPETQNAFEAPKADLSTPVTANPILEMQRFTAWGVFGLSIITLGLYYLYWLFTRMNKINSLSKVAKGNIIALYVYIAATLISNVGQFAISAESSVGIMFTAVITIVSLVSYIMSVFSMRKAVSEVINEGSRRSCKIRRYLNVFLFSYLLSIQN
ncbi:DUF4234 domain-containing protein [Pseudocolwellia sp. HL-MZ19]|uniref:DUF4234 domain-containing protein n=1 Tax=Pseudocolwellia sp. HL-MZ19 TaxID=3400846 RepID=UPI003CF9649F